MTIALVHSQVGSDSTSPDTEFSMTLADFNNPGNVLIVAAMCSNDTEMDAVTDSQGNTYEVLIDPFTDENNWIGVWYAKNITGGPNTVTMSVLFTGTVRGLIVTEWSGLLTPEPFDSGTDSYETTASSHPNFPTITTAADNELVLVACLPQGFLSDSGDYAVIQQDEDNTLAAMFYAVVDEANDWQPQIDQDTSASIWGVNLAFKPTAGSPPTGLPLYVGSTRASAIFVGSTAPSALYVGTTKIA